MAKFDHKRKGELLRGVFKILMDYPDGLKAKTVLEKLEEIVPPTPFENSFYEKHPNQRRFEKIVRFTSVTVTKAGWLLKEKGQWSLTEEGIRAYKKYSQAEEFSREASRLYRKWKGSQPEDEEDEIEDSSEAATTLEEAEESAWDSINSHLQNINPYDFQELVSGLLQAMGYHVAWISPPGPDGGIDLIAYQDPLGVERPRIKVQVKRRKDKINVDGIRAFMALLGDNDIGLFISTGGFTKNTELEARTQEKRRYVADFIMLPINLIPSF